MLIVIFTAGSNSKQSSSQEKPTSAVLEQADPDLEPGKDDVNFQDAFNSGKGKGSGGNPPQTLDVLKEAPGRLSHELVKQGLLSPELLEQLKREWESAKKNNKVEYDGGKEEFLEPQRGKKLSKSGRMFRRTKKK